MQNGLHPHLPYSGDKSVWLLHIFMACFMQQWQDFSAMGVNNKLIIPSLLLFFLVETWANSFGN